MAYRELPQSGPLVACLWLRDPSPEAQTHRVLPDACVDVVWTGARLIVAGPATGPVMAEVPAGAAALGVRFRIGAAGAALGAPAAELLDASVPLEDVWGAEADRIADRVATAPTPAAQLAALASAVTERIARAPGPDPAVRAVATRAAGTPGVGERQLRRRFKDAVGYGPRTLHRILRFQRFLALAAGAPARTGYDAATLVGGGAARAGYDGATPAPGGTARTGYDGATLVGGVAARTGYDGATPTAGGAARVGLARLAFEAGYADQAHLTRECTRLAGLPPAALLAAGAGPAGERL